MDRAGRGGLCQPVDCLSQRWYSQIWLLFEGARGDLRQQISVSAPKKLTFIFWLKPVIEYLVQPEGNME